MFVFCSLFTFSVTVIESYMDSKMNAKLVMCCVLFLPPPPSFSCPSGT